MQPEQHAFRVMAEQCQARGPGGVAVAAAPTAAFIGAEMLRAGGNAFDAAVAAALAETVLLPPKCGFSGDLVAMVWPPEQTEPEALVAVGGAPAALADVATNAPLQQTGPMSVGVPGAPAGYLALAERAMLPLETLVRPAIDLARDGFCWSTICSKLSEESHGLVRRHNVDGTRYFPEDRVIEGGTVTRLRGLARLLEHFLNERQGFLQGPVGEAIIERVQGAGGVLSRSDLRDAAEAKWVAPARTDAGSLRIFATPAPTHGPALLRALGDGRGLEASPAIAVYPCVMAAIDWRRRELADLEGTSMVSAADGEGRLVTVVHSNSYPRFGSGLIVDEFDLILSNRAGRGFSSDPEHANFPCAGRRPATTLHAWGVDDSAGKRYQGATPGGANQMPWNAQTLARLIGGETDIGRLIVAPRWEWMPADDSLRVEGGFSEDELTALHRLAACGVTSAELWGCRSAMQIVTLDTATGVVAGAVDPRTVGGVIGF